jgi:hypothetical protein
VTLAAGGLMVDEEEAGTRWRCFAMASTCP